MTKTEKKIERRLIKALTKACEIIKGEIAGFEWLTHFVNMKNFPKGLSIVCIFDTNDNLQQAWDSNQDEYMFHIIKSQLLEIEVIINDMAKIVSFDTEENCSNENNGKWNDRLK